MIKDDNKKTHIIVTGKGGGGGSDASNAKITLMKKGLEIGSFTLNQENDAEINLNKKVLGFNCQDWSQSFPCTINETSVMEMMFVPYEETGDVYLGHFNWETSWRTFYTGGNIYSDVYTGRVNAGADFPNGHIVTVYESNTYNKWYDNNDNRTLFENSDTVYDGTFTLSDMAINPIHWVLISAKLTTSGNVQFDLSVNENGVYDNVSGQYVSTDTGKLVEIDLDNNAVAWDNIQNKPNFATVATSGNYNDLSNKPLIIDTEYPSETLTFTLAGGETRTVKFLTQPTGYFYVEDVSGSDNTLRIYPSENAPKIDLYYSTDEINWSYKQISYNIYTYDSFVATVPANGRLYLKAVTNGWGRLTGNWGDVVDWIRINCELPFNVGGNIMSLIYGNSFMNKPEFMTANSGEAVAFANLFKEANVVSAANLILPATTLTTSCYSGMFYGCSALTTAPALPATTLAIGCYGSRFYGCSALTAAPALPAPRLEVYCYSGMFGFCSSLTTAPALPAPRLEPYCYEMMFTNCTNLNRIVCYCEQPDTSAMGGWLSNVSPTGDFYNLGGATYERGESGIPEGWTEHTSL